MAQPCSSLGRESYTHQCQIGFALTGPILSIFRVGGASGMAVRSRNPRSAKRLRLVSLGRIVSEKARQSERVSVNWAVCAGGHLVSAQGEAPLSN